MLVHIIADYGYGDLAVAEVVQRLKLHLPEAEPLLTPVPPFGTHAAGFCIAQLGLNESPIGTIIKGGEEKRWMGLFLRGGSASATFGYPAVGSMIDIIAPEHVGEEEKLGNANTL